MLNKNIAHFENYLQQKKKRYPWTGQIELTYRCNLDCLHCYCKGSEKSGNELSTFEWKKILDEIRRAGCLFLNFSGGEPLLRADFRELYFYAKKKGFLVAIFSNGQLFDRALIRDLAKAPPQCVEITLNAITQKVYQRVTGAQNGLRQVFGVIKQLKRNGVPTVIKTNVLKENRLEIAQIMAFAGMALGRPKGKFYFKYDPMIYPRLNGDREPCKHRLSFRQLQNMRKKNPEIWQDYCNGLKGKPPGPEADNDLLYPCVSWQNQFFINPFGRLKFCQFSGNFSTDLKKYSFEQGFYKNFSAILNKRFKGNSKCRNCQLRSACPRCPAKAYLEAGDEEAPVEYYCSIAKGKINTSNRIKREAKA